MILDVSVAEQRDVEDCEICCNPIQIDYSAEDFEIKDFTAESLEQ